MKLLVAAMLFAGLAVAQNHSVYAYVAPGGRTGNGRTVATAQVGLGLEIALPKGLGAGVEVGAISPFHAWGDGTLGTIGGKGYYHFIHGKGHRIDPYATGGYTWFIRDGSISLYTFGGGVNVWATKHLGAKVEVYDQKARNYDSLNYWGFKFGIALR